MQVQLSIRGCLANIRAKAIVLVSSTALLALFSINSWSAGLYAELAHASNARATDRDLGRNFVHVGWGFANGIMVSGGTYFVGEESCFKSLTLGRKFAQERWQVSLTGHDKGICAIDSRQAPFNRNIGLCATRLLPFHPRWSFGIGGCVWQRPDHAIGNLADPVNPLSVVDDGPQLTAMLLIRFSLSREQSGRTR